MGITYSERVFVALDIQHAMSMRHIVMCSLSDCKLFFPHYIINNTIFDKQKTTEHKMCVLIFSASFETFTILRRTEQYITNNVYWSMDCFV